MLLLLVVGDFLVLIGSYEHLHLVGNFFENHIVKRIAGVPIELIENKLSEQIQRYLLDVIHC